MDMIKCNERNELSDVKCEYSLLYHLLVAMGRFLKISGLNWEELLKRYIDATIYSRHARGYSLIPVLQPPQPFFCDELALRSSAHINIYLFFAMFYGIVGNFCYYVKIDIFDTMRSS